MREIEMNTNQSEPEERLVGALRRLAREASRDASPDVGAGLAAAFRRHHRRRRTRNAAIAVLAICFLVSAALFLARPQKPAPSTAKQTPSPVVVPVAPPNGVLTSASVEAKKSTHRGVRTRPRPRQPVQSEARQAAAFLPLPSYDSTVAKDDLQIIRVEMPIQDLRLVGAPVGADVPNRRVRADFVVGHDGTPYAVRLVQ